MLSRKVFIKVFRPAPVIGSKVCGYVVFRSFWCLKVNIQVTNWLWFRLLELLRINIVASVGQFCTRDAPGPCWCRLMDVLVASGPFWIRELFFGSDDCWIWFWVLEDPKINMLGPI